MELGIFEHREIRKYFSLPSLVRELRQKKRDLQYTFYHRTLTSRVEERDMNLVAVSCRIERIVPDHVDLIREVEIRIEKNIKKYRYFQQYLHTLGAHELEYIHHRYETPVIQAPASSVDHALYEEIQEIEEAICFMYKLPFEPETDLQTMDFENILSLLEV